MTNKDFFDHLTGSYGEGNASDKESYDAELMKSQPSDEGDVAVHVKDDVEDDAEGHLIIDVYENDASIIIESAVAGVGSEDLDISITPESVSIRGKRQRNERVSKKDFLWQECFWGSFSRSVALPQEIDPEKAKASLNNGVLRIVLPKLNRKEKKKLKVKVD